VVVGYFGRLVNTKGVDTIIRSVKKCRSHVELLVVGDGPERRRLQDLVRNLELTDRVRFMDGVASGELPILYQKIDIFVLASRTTPTWKEQYGRVLIEAMAAEVPVIGSSSGAIPEIIGSAGRVFLEGDAAALAREIDNLVENRELRKKLRQSGRKRAKEFSARQFADSMYAALSEMFHERNV
jgi:glycosyltransferase involved in cell wall biosynthesis